MPFELKAPRFRVQSPFLGSLRARFGRFGRWLLVLLVPLFLLRGCFITYVPPDQIGVRQVSFGPGRGLHKEVVSSGYRREVSGYESVYTFPREIQVVEFTNHPSERGAAAPPDRGDQGAHRRRLSGGRGRDRALPDHRSLQGGLPVRVRQGLRGGGGDPLHRSAGQAVTWASCWPRSSTTRRGFSG